MKQRPRHAAAGPVLAVLLLGVQCSNVGGGVPALPDAACGAGGTSGGDDGGVSCASTDGDGITGGCSTFHVTVDDHGFSPIILKAQNFAQITLDLTNAGTRPHDFVVGCIPDAVAGCPPMQCFPAAADLAAVAPGKSATTTFVTPALEGIYVFRSDVGGDSAAGGDGGVSGLWGQFVVQ